MVLWFVLPVCSLTLHYLRDGRGGVKLSYTCEGSPSGSGTTLKGVRYALICRPYGAISGAQAALRLAATFQIALKPEAFMVNRLQVLKSAAGRNHFPRARRIQGSFVSETSRSSSFYSPGNQPFIEYFQAMNLITRK